MVSRRGSWPLWLAFALFSIAAGSCTLWSDYSDGLTCGKDEDCFRAQGEVCDLAIKECVVKPQPKLLAPVAATPAQASNAEPVETSVQALGGVPLPALQRPTQTATQVQP